MFRAWHPYTAWEDYRAGMWRDPVDVDGESEKAADILSDPDLFRSAGRQMLVDWPNAAEQNLSGPNTGVRAWIGQATCFHLAGVPEESTRAAWWRLTDQERDTANAVADEIAAEWREEYENQIAPPLFILSDDTGEPNLTFLMEVD